MRVAFDSNVIISAIVFPSKLLDEAFLIASADGNRLVLSEYVVEETIGVIRRKWPDMVDTVASFFNQLDFELVATSEVHDNPMVSIRDPKDYPVIASAVDGHCDVLVTGDRDFEDLAVARPIIMTPKAFADTYGLAG